MNKLLLEKLKHLKPILREKYGIKKFAIFGSQARDDYSKKSDVDIIIFEMEIKSGFDIIYAKQFLEKELKKGVDIGTFKSLKTFIKEEIKEDLIYV